MNTAKSSIANAPPKANPRSVNTASHTPAMTRSARANPFTVREAFSRTNTPTISSAKAPTANNNSGRSSAIDSFRSYASGTATMIYSVACAAICGCEASTAASYRTTRFSTLAVVTLNTGWG